MKIISLILALYSAMALSYDINTTSPRETFKSFLKSMKEYKQGKKSSIYDALKTLDLSQYDQLTRDVQGQLVAQQLINTLDRLEYITYDNIPEKVSGDYWVYKKQTVLLGNKQIPVEISLSKTNKQWIFSNQTINSIKHFEKSLLEKQVVSGAIELKTWRSSFKQKMPAWTGQKAFFLMNGQWLALICIIIFGLALERIIQFFFAKVILAQFRKISFDIKEDSALKRFKRALGISIYTLSWIVLLPLLELQDGTLTILLRASKIICTVGLVWSTNHLVHIIAEYFIQVADKTENKFDDILVPLLRKAAKVFIFALGAVFIAHSFTLDITNLLAGLGIGGLAFALAAKDTLSNLFGSLTVILDRPFEIGDAVVINTGIEGAVESVGFRSTKIRTWYDSLITVPNSQLTNVHIDNLGRREYRRLSTTLGIQYNTSPEQVEAFCQGVRHLISIHPDTKKEKDAFHVYFHNYGASSLDIMLYCFFKDEGRARELQSRHALLMSIFKLASDLKVDFAFPTQTVHLFNETQ